MKSPRKSLDVFEFREEDELAEIAVKKSFTKIGYPNTAGNKCNRRSFSVFLVCVANSSYGKSVTCDMRNCAKKICSPNVLAFIYYFT